MYSPPLTVQCQDAAGHCTIESMDGGSPYMHYEKLLSLRVPYVTDITMHSIHITANFRNDNYYY